MVILVWYLWCWAPGPRRPQGHEWHAPPLVSTIRARICGVTYIYICIYSGSMWFHVVPCGSMWFHVVPCGSIKSSQGKERYRKQSAAWNIKKTAVRLHIIITIQNCRVLSAACGEWLGMRRRHFCDCLAGHWATICEAMRGKNGNQGMGDITLGPTSSAKTPAVYVNRMEGHTHRLCPSQSWKNTLRQPDHKPKFL